MVKDHIGFWGEYDFLMDYFNLTIDKVVVLLRYILFYAIKRNDLCPCGSGRLVKRCHGKQMIELLNGIRKAELEKIYFELLEFLKETYE